LGITARTGGACTLVPERSAPDGAVDAPAMVAPLTRSFWTSPGLPGYERLGSAVQTADRIQAPQMHARLVFEYLPIAKEWRPVTYYPEP
jgi:hypothetical protein